MSLLIRRMLFACYVFYLKRRRRNGSPSQGEIMLTWRHAYFLFWHRFLWRIGRQILAVFTEVKPLLGDILSPTAYEYYMQFNDMCARDRENRPFVDRVTKQKSFPLAEDTVKALCLFYRYHIQIAPWQYGCGARELARARMFGVFVVSASVYALLLFAHLQHFVDAPLALWITFFCTLFAGVGFFASHCILQIAIETVKMSSENKSP